MKLTRVIVVLALLVGFPLVSYLYLKSGYNFRYDALQQLKPKITVEHFEFPNLSSTGNMSVDALKGKVTLVYDDSNNKASGLLTPIYEKFSDREEFQLISLGDSIMYISNRPQLADLQQWHALEGIYSWEKELALIDTSGTIRNYYTFDSLSFHSLAQHIPIIMPREVEQDIKMKSK